MRTNRSIAVFAVALSLSACVTTTTGPRPATDEEAAVANLNLGVGYLRQGRPDAAIDPLERAIDLNPRLASALSVLALAYEQIGEPELAEEYHRRATQLDVNDADAQNRYAVFLCLRSRWSEAERYFQRAVNNPQYATPAAAYTNAGNCARGADDLAKAEANYRAALAIDAGNVDALAGMLELAVHNQNYLQARAFAQRALSASAPTARNLWLCAYVERQLGDLGAAENCARQLRAGFPNSPEVAMLRELDRNAER